MLVENGIVRIGAEIEVAAFKTGVTYANVAKELLAAGHMEGSAADWQQYHDYNCTCSKGCAMVKKGDILDPPLVSMQYDASLPNTGAEFIVSPVLMVNGMAEMRPVWDIVTKDARWTRSVKARRGGYASPSIHLHVSAQMPGTKPKRPQTRLSEQRMRDAGEDMLAALSLFAPEMILVSDVEKFRRGLLYRQPWRYADGRNKHHGFVQVKKVHPGQMVYIEWRMFEAAYESWNYFEAGAYFAGALTRALLEKETLARLMEHGYADKVDDDRVEAAIRADDTGALLKMASGRRLEFLRDLTVGHLDDDNYGARLLDGRFQEVMARV